MQNIKTARERSNSGNGWIKSLIGSFVVTLAPTVLQSILQGSGSNLPHTLLMFGQVLGAVGFFWTALQARLSDTVLARLFCFVTSIAGMALAAFLLIHEIKG